VNAEVATAVKTPVVGGDGRGAPAAEKQAALRASGSSATFQPRIVGFLCNWCSYAGADLAGTSRTPYAATVRVIRVMCSARIDPTFVLKALAEGADGVLICGCHPGDCHYSEGNYKTMRRYPLLKRMLADFGIKDERVRLEWVSASEGQHFADVVDDMTRRIRALGPSKVKIALATDRAER
jgi:F420-non-reducing hydrogenase iron-sulfur subunit